MNKEQKQLLIDALTKQSSGDVSWHQDDDQTQKSMFLLIDLCKKWKLTPDENITVTAGLVREDSSTSVLVHKGLLKEVPLR